ncbi:MAG: hypothetical protein RIE08_10640 [Acidimicrobiales bacterium]
MPANSEEIIAKDFDVVRKGFDRDQVKTFLRTVAESVARSEAELQKARVEAQTAERRAAEAQQAAGEAAEAPAPAATPEPDDDFARLGSRVAAVLQSAEMQAAEITDESLADAQRMRSETDEYVRTARGEADEYSRRTRSEADAYAELVRGEAETRARSRVETILTEAAEARDRATAVESALESRLRTALEDVRLTLEAFEADRPSDASQRPGDDADGVLAEVREAAGVFAGASRPDEGTDRDNWG